MPQLVIVRHGLVMLALLLLALPAFARTAAESDAPQAQITFYSSGQRAFGYYNHLVGVFKGGIYEDDRQLLVMEPDYFVTFHVEVGPHTFVCSLLDEYSCKRQWADHR